VAMLLTIDVGNSNIVLGVFEGAELIESWRLATLRERTADEMGIWVSQLFQHRALDPHRIDGIVRSEEHTSELQSPLIISYAVFCLKKKKQTTKTK